MSFRYDGFCFSVQESYMSIYEIYSSEENTQIVEALIFA